MHSQTQRREHGELAREERMLSTEHSEDREITYVRGLDSVSRVSVRYVAREDNLSIVICTTGSRLSCMISFGTGYKSKLNPSRDTYYRETCLINRIGTSNS